MQRGEARPALLRWGCEVEEVVLEKKPTRQRGVKIRSTRLGGSRVRSARKKSALLLFDDLFGGKRRKNREMAV